MNREIKFRAYKTTFGRMDYGKGDLLLRHNSDDYSEVMQFTGLKDKNGKEIYEADIIQYQNECADKTPILVPFMTPKNLEYIMGIGNSEWEEEENQYSNIEVIGNINENKDLLP